jgi:hypothetical protein
MSNREEIAPNGDKRYLRRDDQGRIKTSVEEGRSLSPAICDQRRSLPLPVCEGAGRNR